jgi:hypothetical protein
LEYNIETMRITDPGVEETDTFRGGPKPSIMDAIKAKATVSATESQEDAPVKYEKPTGTPAWESGPKINADVQATKLKGLLNKIKTG